MSTTPITETVKPTTTEVPAGEAEEADARTWEAQFAATPDAKLNKLIEHVKAKIQAGKVSSLDFTDK